MASTTIKNLSKALIKLTQFRQKKTLIELNSLLCYHFVCMKDSWAGWQSHQTIKIEERQTEIKVICIQKVLSPQMTHVKLIVCVQDLLELCTILM